MAACFIGTRQNLKPTNLRNPLTCYSHVSLKFVRKMWVCGVMQKNVGSFIVLTFNSKNPQVNSQTDVAQATQRIHKPAQFSHTVTSPVIFLIFDFVLSPHLFFQIQANCTSAIIFVHF